MEIDPENNDIQKRFQELVEYMADGVIESDVLKALEIETTLTNACTALDKMMVNEDVIYICIVF